MTTRHAFSRRFATLSALTALAAGVALLAAPSAARAEAAAATPIITVADQAGLSFTDVAADEDGGQIVITAAVTWNSTAGKPRSGSVVFSALVGDSKEAGFMDYTDDACMPSLMSRQAGDQACAAISRALHDAAAAARIPGNSTVAPPATTTGIIMRDGGVCDPIRHMGC